ncbi:HAD family hydrolase [Granulicella cerasi]|uniref:HAD family hydrolase n=1 Tax=Granulicella cerasi TaxID=741063 RepID=A0ABW1Z4N7_9BACT|nr:HAD family phosphatase [Granulicella cerasi]
MNPIEAVLFDYGLVLSGPPSPTAWQRMKDALHTDDEEAFHAAYWKFRHDYDRGTLNAAEYWPAVARELRVELTQAQLGAVIEADVELWMQPNEPMITWAQSLQLAGIRTGILSNIGDAMEDGLLSHLPWLHRFDHHTFSHRLRIAKPEREIYRHAAEGLGAPPSSILFIDDREENIAAAREAGMVAIRYTDHEAFVREMSAPGLAELLKP